MIAVNLHAGYCGRGASGQGRIEDILLQPNSNTPPTIRGKNLQCTGALGLYEIIITDQIQLGIKRPDWKRRLRDRPRGFGSAFSSAHHETRHLFSETTLSVFEYL
jgi:hypothetical protein